SSVFGIMAALRPIRRPQTMKREPCSSSDTTQTSKSKLLITGRNPEALILMPNTGDRRNKKIKHILPSSFQKFLVHNVKELKTLLMYNKSSNAKTAHCVSAKKHKAIVERAAQQPQCHPSPPQAVQ
ncbi:60S ribosomal protein L32, partial [Galemys pyrenaicus]